MNKKQKHSAEDLRLLSQLLDSKFRAPFGIKFGLDSIIGLIPIIGDSIMLIVGVYIIGRAWVLGVSKFVLLRMILNSLFDFVFGSIPLFGDVFDLYFRSNQKNYELIQAHLKSPGHAKSVSVFYLMLFSLLALAFVYVVFRIFFSLISFLINLF